MGDICKYHKGQDLHAVILVNFFFNGLSSKVSVLDISLKAFTQQVEEDETL